MSTAHLTFLDHTTVAVQAITALVRSSIDEVDRTGRYGEDVVVTLTFRDGSEKEYEVYARFGYTAMGEHLLRVHRKRNRRLIAKCWHAQGHEVRGEFQRRTLDKMVTHVRVQLRGRRFSTEWSVMEPARWLG